MSLLCGLGLLSQPHTSAGRIPTPLGYKLFIQSLMNKSVLPYSTREYIDSALTAAATSPEALPEKASNVLSEITGLPCFSVDISPNGPILKKIELVKISERLYMPIIITTDGRSRSRLCHTDSALSAEMLSVFKRLAADYLSNRATAALSSAYIQNILSAAGIHAFSLMPIFSILSEMIKDIENSAITFSGQSALFNMPGSGLQADKIASLLARRDTLLSVLSRTDSDLGVVFGVETQFSVLEPSSIVFAKYSAGAGVTGCLGVVGPTRMEYEQILPCIEYTAQKTGTILKRALSEMEE